MTKQLQWSQLNVYDINAPGENHGLLLGTRGWTYDPSRKRGLTRSLGHRTDQALFALAA